MTEEAKELLSKFDHNLNGVLFDLVDENETLEGQVNELREQVARLTEKGSANPNECYEGMTNEEVLNLVLRKIFPRLIFIRGINEWNKTKSIVYSEEWGDAPYKAEKGGE